MKYSRCRVPFIIISIIVGWVSSIGAHVLEGAHVLDLITRKLAGAQTLLVNQQVVIDDPTVSSQPIELKETLSYIFPDRFRSDIQYENSHRIRVFAGGETLTVVDGIISENQEGRFDRYKDLLLYNSRSLLHRMLSTHGVDVGITSLGRMDKRVVVIIGAQYPNETVSQVWVDKERWLPLRWINIFPSEGSERGTDRLEFVYRNWQNVDGVWYPMLVETFHNQQPVRQIRVSKVQTNAVIEGESLNISHLMTLYKKKEVVTPQAEDGTSTDDIDEVERAIEDFDKKFEP